MSGWLQALACGLVCGLAIVVGYRVIQVQRSLGVEVQCVHQLGDTVYLKVRRDRERGMVTGIMVRPGRVHYAVSWSSGETWHYDIELSTTFLPDYSEEP